MDTAETYITRPRAAIVTGAGSGIGAATARRFAADGAKVGLLDRNAESLEKTAAEIRIAGGHVLNKVVDVRSLHDMASAVDSLVSQFGELDAAVAAAGVARVGPVHGISETDWDEVIDVNLKGTFLLARATLPHMLKSGAGAFTAIGSDAGVLGSRDFGAYCASKHGVIGLIKSMALDYGQYGIRSNAVCPGFVETPMADQIFDGSPDASIEAYRSSIPTKRFAKPAEVAAIVAHFSSSDAIHTNGCIYIIDGGSSAGFLIEGS